jgi:RecQ family ATP-dependent DNA helicase
MRFQKRIQTPNEEWLKRGTDALPGVLGRLGYNSLRKGQDGVILNLLAGLDTVAILPTSTGKCLAKGTLVQAAFGRLVPVEDIKVGELLSTPEGGYSSVISTTRGYDDMYLVTDESGFSYMVNSEHILYLEDEDGDRFTIAAAEAFRSHMDNVWYAVKLGTSTRYKITSIDLVGSGEYYGFQLDDAGPLFLLADNTVTHNSACFIVPTLCLGLKSLVISPLTALMWDQVQSLREKGIAGDQISSTQSPSENIEAMKRWVNGNTDILYVAPERFDNKMFVAALEARVPDAVFVDECHVLSIHGDNFRPAYKRLGDVVATMNPRIVGAFTATCPPEMEADIRWILGLQEAKRFLVTDRRENLILSSSEMDSDLRLVSMLKKITGPTIVYYSTIKRLEEAVYTMQNLLTEPITYYHGELSPEVKRTNQRSFREDSCRIILATSSFGMGIDKGNVRHVITRDIPGSIEDLCQYNGRAGRDGQDSFCHTFFTEDSKKTQEFFLRTKHPDVEEVVNFYSELERNSDSSGLVTGSIAAIARSAGVNPFLLDSIMSILVADNVATRATEKDTTMYVKWLTKPQGERMQAWADTIAEGGVTSYDGGVDIDMEWLSDKLGYSSNTQVKKWLKQWESEGYIVYRPPASRPPLQLLGGLDRIDFARLQKKKEADERKLQEVLAYNLVPDKDKHYYTEQIFQLHNS